MAKTKEIALCRDCNGKGKFKLPGAKYFSICETCNGYGKAELKPEDEEKLRKGFLKNTKQTKSEKYGKVRIN